MDPIERKDPVLRLTLYRHAKTERPDTGLDDFNRALTGRGRSAAATMAHAMIAEGSSPSLILCSAARRARETLAGAIPILRGDCRIEIEHGLYLASAAAVLDRLRAIESADSDVAVIGHNPGLQELAVTLAAPANSEAFRDLSAGFPTAALAELEFRARRWSELKPQQGNLRRFVTPRALAREN